MPSSAGSATAAAAAVVSRCLHTAAEESGSAVWNSSLVSPRSPARRPPGSPARRRAMGPRRHSRPATLASHPSPAERAPPGRGCAALRPSTWARPPRRRRTPPPAARRASRRRRPSTAHVDVEEGAPLKGQRLHAAMRASSGPETKLLPLGCRGEINPTTFLQILY